MGMGTGDDDPPFRLYNTSSKREMDSTRSTLLSVPSFSASAVVPEKFHDLRLKSPVSLSKTFVWIKG